MKHPFFTRSVSLLLAVLMVLSLPAAAVDASNAAEPADSASDSTVETTAPDPFDDTGDTALSEDEGLPSDVQDTDDIPDAPDTQEEPQQEPAEESDQPVYFDDEGNYLAPEQLVVYIIAYADPEQIADGKTAVENYTGIVAFFDYNETDREKMLENPWFFYYKDGALQDEEPLFCTADRYLSLPDGPTQTASLADEEEPQTVYTAEEVYVDPDAEEHPDYLFAFNQEQAANGLYTGEKDGLAYVDGLTDVVLLTSLTQDGVNANNPTITWQSVDTEEGAQECEGYQVWRSTDGGSTWTLLNFVSNSDEASYSYTDQTATEEGTTYSYCVCATYPDGGATEKGVSVLSYTCRAKLTEVTAVLAAGGVQLSWTPDSEATGYRVLRKLSDSTDSLDSAVWTEVADLSGSDTEWLDSTASSDVTYSYGVRAYYGTQEGDSREDYTAPVWNCAAHYFDMYYLAAPTLTNAYSAPAGISIAWDKVAGAESYQVYRKDVTGGGWVHLTKSATVTGTTYTDKTAEAGSSYYYTLRAKNSSAVSAYVDSSKDPASAVLYHTTPTVTLQAGTTGILVKWSKDTTATGYRVFRQKSGETKWSVVANITSGSTGTYTDTSAVTGSTYRYTVRAYYGEGKKIASDNNYSTNLWSAFKASDALFFIAAPVLGDTYSEAAGMCVTWTSVPNATGYMIYRRQDNTGTYSWLAQVNGGTVTSYVDKTAVADTAYGYTVKAVYKAEDGTTYTSGYNNPTTSSVYHAAPTVSIAANATSNEITWTLDPQATGYRIHRKVGTGSVQVLTNIDAKSLSSATQGRYTDTELTSGTKYTYYVRAYYGTNSVSKSSVDTSNLWSGAGTQSAIFLSTPVLSAASMTASGIKVAWTKVDGAAGYRVFRKTSGGKWAQIATISNGSTEAYVDSTKLTAGADYFYTVCAVASDNTSLSSHDSTGAYAAYLPAPVLESAVCSSSGTTVKWKAVNGATGYMIYRKTDSTNWERLTTTTDSSVLSYKDTSVKNRDTAYYYTVKAYKTSKVNGKQRTFQGAYDTKGVTFSIPMSGSGWVKKDGNTYYVKDGFCLVGWQYLTRNGGSYKYYFDTKTGALVTNLYSYFGKSYSNLKCRVTVCINTNNNNPSYTTIYLYDSKTDSYCIPAVSVRCVGNPSKTTYSNKAKSAFMKAGTGQRWLDSETCYEQYATYISGTYSWFHSTLYFNSKSPNNFSSYYYNSMINNNNNSNGCVRMQCIYAYLILDIMKNGYGKSNKVPVVLYKNTSNAGPFGVPKVDKISSRKTEPTDPAVTGKFFYDTSVVGVSAKAGAKAWTYY